MSYTKNTWATGDVVTSAKLNNIETGVYNATPLVVTAEAGDTPTFDKTWKEINDAYEAGSYIMFKFINEYETALGILNVCGHFESNYYVGVVGFNAGMEDNPVYFENYVTDNENGYPVLTEMGG